MKSFFLSTASVVAVLGALSMPASAQLAEIDLDAVLDLPGTVVGAVTDIRVLPDGLDTLLPALGTQIAGNTAVNIAPAISNATQVAVPIDAAGILGAGLAVGAGLSPNTASVAAAIGAVNIDRLGGRNIMGDVTQTTFGLLGDQVSQSALVSNNSVVSDVSLAIGSGALVATDEATQAASQVGDAASNAAARYAAVAITTPAVGFTDNTVAFDVDSAVAGLYQGNIAVNLAPALSNVAQVGASNLTGAITQTTFGVLGTQVSSVGIDAAGVVAAIKGE